MIRHIVAVLGVLLLTGGLAHAQQPAPRLVPVPGPAIQRPPETKPRTPEQVYADYYKSLQTGDYAMFITCVTPAKGAFVTFEICFGIGMQPGNRLNEYLDNEFGLDVRRKAGGELTTEQTHALIVASIKDKRAFFRYVAKEFAKQIKDETAEPLRDIKIKGDRARGVVTHYVEMFRIEKDGPKVESRDKYDSPVYFARTENTWWIDNPTPEEIERDRRERNEKDTNTFSPYGRPAAPPSLKSKP